MIMTMRIVTLIMMICGRHGYRSPSQRWKVLSASYSDNSYYDAVKMMTVMINVDADC